MAHESHRMQTLFSIIHRTQRDHTHEPLLSICRPIALIKHESPNRLGYVSHHCDDLCNRCSSCLACYRGECLPHKRRRPYNLIPGGGEHGPLNSDRSVG